VFNLISLFFDSTQYTLVRVVSSNFKSVFASIIYHLLYTQTDVANYLVPYHHMLFQDIILIIITTIYSIFSSPMYKYLVHEIKKKKLTFNIVKFE
jgi:H+/Cl- antiporter ClcA